MDDKENNFIKCKRCGNIVELKQGVPVNKKFLDEFQLEEPRYNYCYECRKKWSEKNLKCKVCGKVIDMHNFYFHRKICDKCSEQSINMPKN